MNASEILAKLAKEYPLLYLNPDTTDQDTYKQVVLKGEEPPAKSLAHYRGNPADRLDIMETPVGPVRVLTLGNRQDFELVLRGLMAAKNGPLEKIPKSTGGSMVMVFNWGRIHAHLAKFPPEQQQAAFQEFISVRENYLDMLVVLSRGPYSNVSADTAGYPEQEWLEISDTIRRYHELTHVICRKRWPDRIHPVRDELIADAVGLYAAYGEFDPEKAMMFLGIRDGAYTGGRLENYTDQPREITPAVCRELSAIRQIIGSLPGAAPFDLLPSLMSAENGLA